MHYNAIDIVGFYPFFFLYTNVFLSQFLFPEMQLFRKKDTSISGNDILFIQ